MLAMIPDMCIRFQAKFRAPSKETWRLMLKSRTSREPGNSVNRHRAPPLREPREALCHISRPANEADCSGP
jgi:hypothetical protein